MWKFYKSATNLENWPTENKKEICFIGRSNVGKSSLINTIANQKIARSSKTPGRTRLLNYFFDSGGNYYVDLPGYGYAKMSKTEEQKMFEMLEIYFEKREKEIYVMLLFDSRHGLTNLDQQMLGYLKTNNQKYLLIGTKADKLKQKDKAKLKKTIEEKYILTSSKKKLNIKEIRAIQKDFFN